MHGCQGCQELMLEHLYDVLDDADQQDFSAHLAGCPECQAALAKARAQQTLLAAAARMPAIDVRFTPPAADAAAGASTPVANAPGSPAPQPIRAVLLPVRPRLREPAAWQPWALAASLLILAVGVGVPAYYAHRDYQAAERRLGEPRSRRCRCPQTG